jgi:tRNA guanosine-2'-O-methyltransferase
LPFLLDGFLPWATLGELFTNTLNVTRNTTISVHGASLADVIARFVQAAPVTAPPPSPAGSDSTIEPLSALHRRAVITGVMDFIIDAEGRIFQFSILYLLEGLVNGLRQCSEELPLQAPLTSADIDKISRVSRLPGLPEIAGDLYKDYCAQLCDLTSPGWADVDMPAYQQIRHAAQKLTTCVEPKTKAKDIEPMSKTGLALQALRDDLESSNHRCIQGEKYAPMCKDFIEALDQMNPASVNSSDLFIVLEAFWEEADRRQFIRPVAVHIPSLLFHPTCVRVCMLQQSESTDQTSDESLSALLTKALGRLQRLAEGRIYVLSTLATSIRRAVLACPDLISILQLEVYILHFVNNPPTIKSEFLFEVAAAEKLQQSQPHRSYKSYYGLREWHAYATMIDLLRRFPEEQISVAKRIFARLLEPWKNQRPGAPVVSKWKNVLQLQAMLLLVDFCVAEFEADVYLTYLRHALTLEAWPRYRFLLEWIIARVYYRFPNKASRILDDLSKLDENSSTHIASLMKLAVLVAPREAEDFSATFMTQLVSFSASPKVQIRHESNYAIPIIYDLATSSGWTNITANPAFRGLDTFVRSLAKFQSTPWTIRTLKLEAVSDYTLMEIFGGQYLTIESPEKERVAYEDFIALHEADRMSDLTVPPERVPLGELRASKDLVEDESLRNIRQKVIGPPSSALPAFFQTKSGFDINSLHPQSAPPSVQNQRPASVILVASLIDNPTNIGGLSRLSESFGLEALYIADLRQTAHKDFKATSVTSEKHFPIHELKVAGVPDFLIAMKTNGYVAVGIEQTDQSAILGSEDIRNTNHMSLGTLPRKCVLVLGSEKGGISAEVLAALDRCVEIRTVGVTRSLSKCVFQNSDTGD